MNVHRPNPEPPRTRTPSAGSREPGRRGAFIRPAPSRSFPVTWPACVPLRTGTREARRRGSLSPSTHPHVARHALGEQRGNRENEEGPSGHRPMSKTAPTHFSICKCDLFLAPKRNANWTRRGEGRKGRPSSLGHLEYTVDRTQAGAGAH